MSSRQDLYYRLNIFPIALPPLRERKGDIPQLVAALRSALLELHGHKTGIKTIPLEVMRALVRHQWPGNIRELQNFTWRAA